ncbi:MAG: serine/threonine-protein kinase [Myxococcota bacterium]
MGGVRTAGSGSEATEHSSGGPRGDVSSLAPGDVVGRYVVDGVLGSGGMGFVVSARDPTLDRPVAIKVLFREDEKGEVWLRREAQALAALNHPGIVVVHDVGVIHGRPFLAMELVDGATLRAWLDAATRTDDEILAVFEAAARGLAAAHDTGVVHCDFKPANVMIRSGAPSLSDAVCIMDFGLARTHAEEPGHIDGESMPASIDPGESLLSNELTGADRLRGTPRYMAPEQFALGNVSPATDQYALCIALYEALWRRSPFRGDTAAERVAEQMIGADPLPPPASRSQRRLAEAVLRGLAPKPEARWPSLLELVDALRAPRRTRWWVAGAAVAVGGVVAGLALAEDSNNPCEGLEARTAAVWNDEVRARIGASFAATERSYAADAWAIGERRIDDWSSRWIEVATQTCRTRADVSARAYDTRTSCLSRQLHRLDAVVEVLEAVDADGVFRALDASALLPTPQACLDEDIVPMPNDPMLATLVEGIYDDIERCIVAEKSATADEYEACTRTVLEVARSSGYEPVVFEARRVHADAVDGSGERERSRELWEALYFDALAAGRTKLAATTALALASSNAREGRGIDLEAATTWVGHASPLRDSPRGASRIARMEALIAHHGGDGDRAIERGRAAVELAEGTDRPNLLATALNTLGKILNERGRREQARPIYERAVKVYRGYLGRVHPRLATALNNLATVIGDMGDPAGALPMFEEALAIRREMLPHEHRHIATGTANVAQTYTRMGQHAKALPLHRESAEVFAAVEGEDSWYHGVLQTSVANNLRELGRLDEASAALEIALGILREYPLEDGRRFGAEAELALLGAARGNKAAAIAFFRDALDKPLRDAERRQAETALERLQ